MNRTVTHLGDRLAIFIRAYLVLLPLLCSCQDQSSSAAPMPERPIVEEIDAGIGHACARFSDGTLRCWGCNEWGQAGVPNPDGDWPRRPTVVDGLFGVIQVSLGYEHTCVLRLNDRPRSSINSTHSRDRLGRGFWLVFKAFPAGGRSLAVAANVRGSRSVI